MIDLAAISTVQYWIFLQVLARVSALIAVAPALGAKEIPTQVKIGLTILLSIVIVPLARSSFPVNEALPDNLYGFISALLPQAAIGLLMGFVVSLILSAFQLAGSLLDLQVGFTMAEALNPTTNDLASPIGQFQYFYGLLLFLLADGHHILIAALVRSFSMLPASSVGMGGPFLSEIADVTYACLVNGLKIAAPVVAVVLIVDFSFAFLNRAMPQLNVFYVGLPVKVLTGLTVLGLILPAIALFAGQLVSGEPQMLTDLFRSLRRQAPPGF
jgi:flagellar biosynthetic protein FliR